MTAFGFDESDLEANRNGALSERQSTRLNIIGLSILTGGGLLILGWIAAIGSLALFLSTGTPLFPGQQLLLLSILLARFVIQAMVKWSRIVTDLLYQPIASAEGYPQVEERRYGRESQYFLHFGGETARIGANETSAFVPVVHCRIYYLPRSKKIVSAEALPDTLGQVAA